MICMCLRYFHHVFSLRKSILQFRARASPGKPNYPCPRTGDTSIAASCTASMLCFIPLRPPPLAASTGTQWRKFELQNFALQFSILAFQLIRPWSNNVKSDMIVTHMSGSWTTSPHHSQTMPKIIKDARIFHDKFCLASLGTLRNLVERTPPTLPSCSRVTEAWKKTNCKRSEEPTYRVFLILCLVTGLDKPNLRWIGDCSICDSFWIA